MGGRLTGKRAVVLGASSTDNMGQHIARRFLAEGASVLVSGRKQDALEAFAADTGAEWAICDITDPASVAALADAAATKLGGVDIAVNASGWGLLKPFLDTTHDELAQMTALQFIGPFNFFQAMIRKMARSLGGGGGSLIQISSATATIMPPIWAPRPAPTTSSAASPTSSAPRASAPIRSRPGLPTPP